MANNDSTVQPELQRIVVKRLGAATYEIDSRYVPMLSDPHLVIDVIRTEAKAVHGSKATTALRNVRTVSNYRKLRRWGFSAQLDTPHSACKVKER